MTQDSFSLPLDAEALKDALHILKELHGYLYSISPSVPTALGHARKVESFLNGSKMVEQERVLKHRDQIESIKHGLVSSPSGMPVLALEVSNNIGVVSIPRLPISFDGKQADQLHLITQRLSVNKKETFNLVSGPLVLVD